MKTSKVVSLLSKLTKVELNRLEKFVNSPYFNSHQDTIRLFELLKDAYPGFPQKKVSKQRIYSHLFPKSSYNENRLHVVKKYLYRLTLDFLNQESMRKSGQFPEDTLQSLSERGMEKHIPKLMDEGKKKLLESPVRNAGFYFQQFRIASLEAEFAISGRNRAKASGLGDAISILDQYYLAEKLKLACYILSRQKILGGNKEVELLEEIIGYCASRNLEESPLIDIYFQALMMLYEEDGAPYYSRLRERIGRNHSLFPDKELISLYTLLINFASGAYKRGNSTYLSEMLSIYQEMLEIPLFTRLEAAFLVHFKNIVTLGLKLKQFEWTESFITSYQEKLAPDKRHGMVQFNLASLYFERKEYRASILHLQQMDFVDPFLRLNFYMLLLKNYYECEVVEPFFSLCVTFRTYLRRSKSISEQNKQAYVNMIVLTRKFFRVKLGNKGDLEALMQETQTSKLLVNRDWLFEKAGQMK